MDRWCGRGDERQVVPLDRFEAAGGVPRRDRCEVARFYLHLSTGLWRAAAKQFDSDDLLGAGQIVNEVTEDD